MYTQLLKNALIDMEHDRAREMQTLVAFLRDRYKDDQRQLDLINKFERQYGEKTLSGGILKKDSRTSYLIKLCAS
jgi:hypothetical protein